MTARNKENSWRAPLAGAALIALALAGCSGDMPGLRDVKAPSISSILPNRGSGLNQEAASSTKPLNAGDYVDPQGTCAGASQAAASEDESAAAAPPLRGVGLSMTECQVVQRLGTPQATDITSNERGDRVVTMTYLNSDRAGLYRFIAGRLTSIERAPGAAQPEPPAKKPKRQSRSNGPA